ncbi:MAG: Hsp20/alpha crystallin family protein [Candidatus Limivicinus sp.]|jgi:HSP20 family protein
MFDLMNRNSFMHSYNPFREMENFERSAFRNFFDSNDLAEFKTDVSDEGDHYLLEADLPGFDKKDISLELSGDVLTVSAERHSKLDEKDDKDKIVRMERSYGVFSRQYDVSGVDVDKISAEYENGVLKLTMPKLQEVVPESRRLEIK